MTAPLEHLEQLEQELDEDPYPSLQHVRTSASGLLRFPDDGLKITPSTIHKVYDGLAGLEEGEEEGRPCPVLQRGGDENHSQSR